MTVPLLVLSALLPLALAAVPAPAVQDAPPAAAPAPAPPAPAFDRESAGKDVLAHLTALIGIDTRNNGVATDASGRPDGNELEAARWFASVLEGTPGVEVHVLESAPGRGNLVAILRAQKASARPVVVMGHLDVVGVDASRWSTPPLKATQKDGYLYGRGAIDCKGPLAASLVALQRLAAERENLLRDIVFVATAAEEGGPDVGIDWLLEHHRDLLGDAEFALNEGGRVRLGDDGQVTSVNVQVSEKLYYTVRVTAEGPSGHGSVPLPDNALVALARAVARIHDARAPVELSPITRAFFGGTMRVEADAEIRGAIRRMLTAEPDSADSKRAAGVVATRPEYNAVMRSAWALTRLDGGFRDNVIPSTGSATFNVRVLPGDDITEIVAFLQKIADEPGVRVELDGEPRTAAPDSPRDTDLYRALESAAAQMVPDAVVIPFMSPGGTDGAALRAAGIPTYGILPIPLRLEDELRMHGDDERAPLDGLGWAAEYMWRVLRTVSLPGPT